MKFDDLVHVQHRPKDAVAADRTPVGTVDVVEELRGGPNDRFVGSLFNRRKARHTLATRRRFLKGGLAAASATAAAAAAVVGPAKEVFAVDGPVTSSGGTEGYRILSKCAAAYAAHNCAPGCGSTPVCNPHCCTPDGWYRNEPSNGYILVPNICVSGGVQGDGWLWTYQTTNLPSDASCAHCVTIQFRCHDGAYESPVGSTNWITSICRHETFCSNEPVGSPVPTSEPLPTPFVPATPAPTPVPCSAIGTIESITDNSGGQVTMTGWAKGNGSGPVTYEIEVDGVSTAVGPANVYRPDIQAAVMGAGSHHGFVANLTGVSPGSHTFCLFAIDNVCRLRLTCVTLVVGAGPAPTPEPGTTPVPNSTPTPAAPVPVRPTPPPRPGEPVATATPIPQQPAPTPQPVLTATPVAAQPTAVPQPTATPLPPQPAPTETPVPGPTPPGSLPPLGTASGHRPIGSVDVLQAGRDNGAFASGWAGDPDTRLPVHIVAAVNGDDVAQTVSSLTRPDVSRAFPHLGPTTGWTLPIPFATPGPHSVCIYLVDPEDGRRFLLGCRDITGPSAAGAPTSTTNRGATSRSGG